MQKRYFKIKEDYKQAIGHEYPELTIKKAKPSFKKSGKVQG